jgi:hypothetical protein
LQAKKNRTRASITHRKNCMRPQVDITEIRGAKYITERPCLTTINKWNLDRVLLILWIGGLQQ